MSKYRWVWHEGEKLYDVGIRADGTLHNSRGYPDEVVRTAVMAADARKRERRSDAAKQAAQTRQYRIRVRVHRIAKRIVAGQAVGPSDRCVVCGKQLADRESIDRRIGSECWRRSRGRARPRPTRWSTPARSPPRASSPAPRQRTAGAACATACRARQR